MPAWRGIGRALPILALGALGCEYDNYEYDEFPVILQNDSERATAFRWESAEAGGGRHEVIARHRLTVTVRAVDEVSYYGGGFEVPASEVDFEAFVAEQLVASITCWYVEGPGPFRQVTWSGEDLRCINWPEKTD